ncbi:hypothetical protein ACKZDW_09095 [Ralstonia syzygii subsp. celebesensis]|nr:hypothetical protein [Ralstonia syzygii]QQV54622.1 hypothetical protein JK151_10590 [Ralstonia syzygii subsp. celebesensis]
MQRLSHLKGIALYAALVIGTLCFHAFALHLDEEAQRDARERIAHQQA